MLTTTRRQVRDTAYPLFERASTAIVPGTGEEVGVNEPRYVGGNYSLRFDGVDDYVDVGNESVFDIPADGSMSVEGFIRCGTTSGYQAVLSKTHWIGGTSPGWFFGVNSSGYLFARFANGERSLRASTSTVDVPVAGNEWRHVGVVFDREAGRIQLYVDGVLVYELNEDISTFGAIASSARLQIGAGGDPTNYFFSGNIDALGFYNLALTPQEMAERASRKDIARKPVARWDFDEGHGDVAHDTAERINLLPLNVANGGEDGTITGLFQNGNGVEVTVTSEDAYEGQRCICVNADGNFDWQGIITSNIPTVPGKLYTASAWIKGTAGETISFRFRRRADVNDYKNYTFEMNGSWQYVRISSDMNEVDGYRTHLRVDLGQKRGRPVTFYVDALMFHEGDVDIPFVLPKETPYNGEIMGAVFDQDNPFFEQDGFGSGLLVEEGTTNLVTRFDGDFESYTIGASGIGGIRNVYSGTSYKVTEHPKLGKCLYVVGDSGVDAARIELSPYASGYGPANTEITISLYYVKDNAGVSIDRTLLQYADGTYARDMIWTIKTFDLGGGVLRYTLTGTPTKDWERILLYHPNGASGWLDKVQVEYKPFVTTFTTGTRAPEILRIPTAGVLSAERGQIDVDVLVNDLVKNAPGNNRIWELGTSSGTSKGYSALYHVHDHKVWSIITYNGSESASLSIPSDPYDGVCRFTVKWEKDRLSLLINGVLVNSRSSQRIPVDLRDFWIYLGRRPNNTGYINTSFYGFRILSTPMSDDEIAAEYGKPLSVTPTTTYLLDFNKNLRQENGIVPTEVITGRFRTAQTVVF